MLKLFVFLVMTSKALGEWVGNMTLFPSNKTYHNLTMINLAYKEFNSTYQICRTEDCAGKAKIYFEPDLAIFKIKNSSQALAIIVGNERIRDNLQIPVFRIPSDSADGLADDMSESLHISYNFDCNKHLDHCTDLLPILIVTGVSLIFWILLTALWIYNTCWVNSSHTELFHKFSTTILIFKLLHMAALFILLYKCPMTERMAHEFFILINRQTRSLYETSFYAYLLLLSKGWMLVINSMERKEFNYLVMVIIFIYVFDSALNIIGLGMQVLTIIIYLLVIPHMAGFAILAIKSINTNISIIRETGIELLIPVALKKRRIFLCFLLVSLAFFLAEIYLHLCVEDNADDYSEIAKIYAVDEAMEITWVGIVFWLYRARDMGRFFTADFNSRARAVIPFYESSSLCEEGTLMIIQTPRNQIMIGKPT